MMDELQILQTAVEASPVAMSLYTGTDLTIRMANKAMLNIWQKDGSVIGKPVREALPELITLQIQHNLTKVYQNGVVHEVTELRLDLIFNKQLKQCYYNVIFNPLKDAGNNIWGILVTAIDVTTQVLAKNELNVKDGKHENDQKFRDLIGHAPVAIGVFQGWDMVIESANESLLHLWGKNETIIGLPLLQALPEIKEQFFMDLLRGVYTTGKPYYGYEVLSHLYRNNHLQDAYFNFVYKPVIESDGKINKVLVVANEVTAQVVAKQKLEESEKRFKSLILEAPMATALYMGRELVINVANDAMLGLWGKDASIIGKQLALALPELEGQPFLQLLDDVFTTGIPYHTNESKADLVVNGKLQSFYFNFTYKPLLDTENRVYGIINMAVDVTSQVNARIELEEIARKKDDFLNVASHEMKTPLTSLKASMQLIGKLFKTDPASPVIPVFIQKANLSLAKILHLIDDLMQVSKLQQGQIPLNKTWFKLADLLNECCDHVRAENKHQLLLEGDADLHVYADRTRIDQVVVNFVNNAVKYAPESQKIILWIEKINDTAKLSIIDFGIGIPLEKQKHLFDRYYRVDYSGIQFSGLGLGLYIAAEIIERHGGGIGVNSTVGEGSTFWFTLPI
jgi:signal transduction histidine kinase